MNQLVLTEVILKLPPIFHLYLSKLAEVKDMDVPTFIRNEILFDFFWRHNYTPIFDFLDEHAAKIEKEFEALGLRYEESKKKS